MVMADARFLNIRDWPTRILSGVGAVERLPGICAELGVRRALVVCGAAVAGGPILTRVRAALGPLCAGVFDEAAAHTPLACVERGVDAVKALGADVAVSVGGGSTIDAAKGIAILRASGGDLASYAMDRSMERAPLPSRGIAHIAVPTTAGSSSEVMPTAAILDPEAPRKLLFWDSRLVPGAVVLDPELAVHAGPELTAATGMTALARCIESLYSRDRNPIAAAMALHGARLLRRSLGRSVARPHDLDARADCQFGCLMSGVAGINAMVSLVHAVGHVVGGRHALQHGVSHAMLLAPAMRVLLPAIGEDQFAVLEAMGGRGEGSSADAAGTAAADAMAALVASLPLPRSLSEVGVARADLGAIARATLDDYMMGYLPRPLGRNEVLAVLESVY